jgi:hypothetical protein
MRVLPFLLLPLILLACGDDGGGAPEVSPYCSGPAIEQTKLPAVLAADGYLSREIGTYRVTENLMIDGAALCVEPGVVVEIDKGCQITVGGEAVGALIVDGHLEDGSLDPVIFRSSASAPHVGDWDKILFSAKADSERSRLVGAIVEHAGAYDLHGKAAVALHEASVEMRQLTVRNGLGFGVVFDGPNAWPRAFEDVHFEKLGEGAFSVSAQRLHHLSGPITLTDDVPRVELTHANIYEDTRVPDLGVPWRLMGGSVATQNGAVLTVEAGVRLELDAGVRLTAGGSTPGGIELLGAADAPVLITSLKGREAPGAWDKIALTLNTTRAVIRHTVLEYGGQSRYNGGQGSLIIGGPLDELSALTVKQGAGAAVLLREGGVLPGDLSAVTLDAHEGALLGVTAGRLADLALAEAISHDLDAPHLAVLAGILTEAVDLSWLAWPVHVLEPVIVGEGGHLSLGAGADWRFDAAAGLTVGLEGAGGLTAVGDEAAPVVFTSLAEEPAPGDWLGLTFEAGSQDTNSTLQHVEIAYGGADSEETPVPANLSILGGDPAISHTLIRASAGHGVHVAADAQPIVDQATMTYEDNTLEDLHAE